MKQIHITANSRLSATLKKQAIQTHCATVIETPVVMTLPQWWQQWREGCLIRGELSVKALPAKVLNGFESLWLWEQVLQQVLQQTADKGEQEEVEEQQKETIETSDDHRVDPPHFNPSIALLNVSSTAKWLQQAWTLSQEWLPESWLESPYLSDESQLFKQCQIRYRHTLQCHNWVDEVLAQQQFLNDLQQGKGGLPEQFCLHGFDEIPPFMQQWQRIVEERGVSCQTMAMQTVDSATQMAFFYAAQDEQDEVQQVALWCVAQWQALSQSKPLNDIRIGVVSPNVADCKTALTQCLDEQLYLQGLQPLHIQRTSPPFYNLSLGLPLSESPLVQNALLSLQLFLMPNKPCAYQDWSQWLTSVYTHGDLAPRQQADAAFRQLQWANFCWPKLLKTNAAQRLPSVLQQRLAKESMSMPRTIRSLSEFVIECQAILQRMAWTQSRPLNSDEYQQKIAFESALVQFGGLIEMGGKQSVSEWLSRFKRFLSEQLHQSQSQGLQPIQIMGVLEAGGQPFDALWVLGLSDEAWPRAANPNPFLPIALQRDVGSPRCDAKRELNYAQQVTERLAHSATQTVWSYAQQKNDAEQLESPLIEVLNLNAYTAKPYQSLALSSFQKRPKSALQWVVDAQGTDMPKGRLAPGGTGILKAQSQCPLMAFMDYRLGAKYGLQTVEEGLQDSKQGIVVHRILERFWQDIQTQEALNTLSEEELKTQLNQLIEQVFAEQFTTLETAYLKGERQRLFELCFDWLHFEKNRPSFRVIETEREYQIALAGILFKVVIDRVDDVRGGKIILDYKTGKATINDLLKTPNKAPQLAVYLHALEERVAGIGYGILHSDDGVSISAIVEEAEVLNNGYSIQVFAKKAEKKGEFFEVAWNDFLDHLKQQVQVLAEQIQRGEAPVVFEKEADIQYAHCKLALRLPEVKQQQSTL